MTDERRVIELLREADPARAPLTTPDDLDPTWQTIVGRIERGHDPEGSPNGAVSGLVQRPPGSTGRDDTTTRGADMHTKLDPAPSRDTRAGRDRPANEWYSRAAVLLVVAAALVAAAWLFARIGAGGEVVTDGQGVPEPVKDFVAAFNAGDVSAVEATLTDDAVLLGEGRPLTGETSKFPQWTANMFALDAELALSTCTEIEGDGDVGGTWFACAMTGSTAVSRAIDERYEDNVRFAVDGQQILGHGSLFGVLEGPAIEQLGAYLYDNHFEAYSEACDANWDTLNSDTGCMEFLRSYLDEFAASR